MNYIREINAFYDWLETNQASQSEIVLWHALMHINNKSGWIPQFAVAISVLEVKTGLKKKTLERARNSLAQYGLIEWKSRKGNQAALYTMNSLWVKFDPQHVPQSVPQHVPQHVPQSVPITKQKETKLNIDDNDGAHAVFEIFKTEIDSKLTPIVKNELVLLIEKYKADAVSAAISSAAVYGARNLKYVQAILMNSNSSKPQVSKNKGGWNRQGKVEIVPDWFYKQDDESDKQAETETDEYIKKRRERLKAELEEMRVKESAEV